MARINFTLEAWLKDKSQKVETGEGESVRILCTNAEGVLPIIGNVGEESENLQRWTEKGQYHVGLNTPNKDLFIVTPEEELTDFEDAFGRAMMEVPEPEEKEEWYPFLKEKAAELLSLAREQFIKDGYVIERKSFHDAVEKIEDKYKAKMSVEYSSHCKVENGVRHAVMNWDEFQKVAQYFIDCGKAEAMKDLPRWKKATGQERFNERLIVLAGDNDLWCTNYAEEGEYYIPFSDLEKLPKEDEK